MNKEHVGGELLFLKYAFPCAWTKQAKGLISRKHFRELENAALNNLKPRRGILKFCFPHAFQDLRRLAGQTRKKTWDIDNVKTYWHEYHGHEGDCKVLSGEVVAVEDKGVMVKTEHDLVLVINIYGIALIPGDKVYTHQRCVVERI